MNRASVPMLWAGVMTVLSAASAGCQRPAPHGGVRMNPVYEVQVPPVDEGGPDVKPTVLLDTAAVKVVSIRFRRGAVLPDHSARSPVVIQASQGRGVLRADGRDHVLGPGQFVVLAANVVHSVTASSEDGPSLIVLVQYMKGAQP